MKISECNAIDYRRWFVFVLKRRKGEGFWYARRQI